MHKTGRYLDFRIVFTPSLKHEIPNLVFNLDSLEKKFGAVVNWVLKNCAQTHGKPDDQDQNRSGFIPAPQLNEFDQSGAQDRREKRERSIQDCVGNYYSMEEEVLERRARAGEDDTGGRR